jgi:DNA-binding beta-propeller fold protein YncE
MTNSKRRITRPGLVAVAVAALSLEASAMETTATLRLEHEVDMPDVAGRIDHLSIDLATGRLFMAALGNDTVEVVDVKAARRLHTIRGVAEPQGILFVPAVNRLFVASGKDGSVRVFDGATLQPLHTVSLGRDADNLRLDAASGRIWVGYGDGALAAMDAGGAKLADIPVGGHPESFQLEKNGPRIFVNVPDARTIAVVDRTKGVVIARWATGAASANFPMALDEAGKRLFVVCRRPARLLVLDTDTGRILNSLSTVGDADDVFYDALAKRMYVSGGEGAIAVYRQSGADYAEVERIATVPGARTSFFSADLRRLFLAVRRQGAAPAAIWAYSVSKD